MEKDEKLKFIYEQTIVHLRYFLDWRNKLLTGYIVIISAIGYFIFTWIQKPENYSNINYILVCSCGIIITILFAFLNHKTTELIWKCQNKAYMIEKELGIIPDGKLKYLKYGLFGGLIHLNIRNELDNGLINDFEKGKSISIIINPKHHAGVLNCFFIIVLIIYIILILQICDLNVKKDNWIKYHKQVSMIYSS